jgi:3-oxoacyl-[acyl-carrier-protein] synthase III
MFSEDVRHGPNFVSYGMTQAALEVRIAGLGSYLPERIVSNTELEAKMGLQPGWIAKRTGVLERRYVTHETTVSQAVVAAQVALSNAGVGLEQIDAIIGANLAQQTIPCTAALLQKALGAPDGASACWDVNATCLSFMMALHSAALLIASGQYKTILIFSSEIASPSLNPLEPESASLFGDAAAAVVLTAANPNSGRSDRSNSSLLAAKFRTFSSGSHLTQLLGGGTLHRPQTTFAQPELNLFHMDGPAVFKHAARSFPPFLESFLRGVGWSIPSVDALVPHQASGHGVLGIAGRLGFSLKQTVYNLPTRGNCVAASMPLALTEAVEAGRIKRGDRVLLAGTAAGLTLGAIALIF